MNSLLLILVLITVVCSVSGNQTTYTSNTKSLDFGVKLFTFSNNTWVVPVLNSSLMVLFNSCCVDVYFTQHLDVLGDKYPYCLPVGNTAVACIVYETAGYFRFAGDGHFRLAGNGPSFIQLTFSA